MILQHLPTLQWSNDGYLTKYNLRENAL